MWSGAPRRAGATPPTCCASRRSPPSRSTSPPSRCCCHCARCTCTLVNVHWCMSNGLSILNALGATERRLSNLSRTPPSCSCSCLSTRYEYFVCHNAHELSPLPRVRTSGRAASQWALRMASCLCSVRLNYSYSVHVIVYEYSSLYEIRVECV